MNANDINNLIEELISLGEDRDELSYWLQIYPHLSESRKRWLEEHLAREAEALRK